MAGGTYGAERRAFPRTQLSVLATIQPEGDGASAPVTMVDLSLGGALLHTNAKLEEAAGYTLRFRLGETSITTPVTIVRKGTSQMGAYFYGCSFKELLPAVSELITRLTAKPKAV